MEDVIFYFNTGLFVLFGLLYFYQIFYVGVSLFHHKEHKLSDHKRKYAILISARNEASVISGLLTTLQNQTYPKKLYDIYVCADNCTDNTAGIARSFGVQVYERASKTKVGKGYALDYMLHRIFADKKLKNKYDAIMVFDADNLLDEHFIEEMDAAYDSKKYVAMTSYRNSKNFASSWISAGYALWFLREARWLSEARAAAGGSCMISGTGFLVSMPFLKKQGGWKHHLLTEDIEFSVDTISKGHKIGYAKSAVLYDEQPITFRDSWNQRLRWAKGFYQVLHNYASNLVSRGVHTREFACYDAFCTIAPALLLSLSGIIMNLFFIGAAMTNPDQAADIVISGSLAIFFGIFNFCFMLFVFAVITLISERKNIYATTTQKIFYLFTFPVFMLTYIPIAVVALTGKVQWKPIQHSIAVSVEDVKAHQKIPMK